MKVPSKRLSILFGSVFASPRFNTNLRELLMCLSHELGETEEDLFDAISHEFGNVPRNMNKQERAACLSGLEFLLKEARCNVPAIRKKLKEFHERK